MHVLRKGYLTSIDAAFRVFPIVTVVGPRQCGKTTLAREYGKAHQGAHFFDLERPSDQKRLENPEFTLSQLSGLVVIDESQRLPVLFEYLRYHVDQPDSRIRLLLTGSASPDLIRGSSESLAGRTATIDLGGFSLDELSFADWNSLWHRGGFPRAFLANSFEDSFVWRDAFIQAFLERDIPQMGIRIPSETLRRFWSMIAHYHGQIWLGSEFARSLGTSEPTARRYLDILAGAYMVRVLPPWHENLKKRQVKSPKIYIRDSGILHGLLDLRSPEALLSHPKAGASWEGFAVEQILQQLKTRDAYFWATHAGAELDLFIRYQGKRYGFEFKITDTPTTTRSMRIALQDLNLDRLWVIHPGKESYALDEQIEALSITDLSSRLKQVAGSPI